MALLIANQSQFNFEGYPVIDALGNYNASDVIFSIPFSVQDFPFYDATKTAGVAMWAPLFPLSPTTVMLTYSLPVYSLTGEFEGVSSLCKYLLEVLELERNLRIRHEIYILIFTIF